MTGSRALLCAAILLRLGISMASAQELETDPDRVFITPLRWERVEGVSGAMRQAHGTVVILYREGIYAKVAGSFTRKDKKGPHPVGNAITAARQTVAHSPLNI